MRRLPTLVLLAVVVASGLALQGFRDLAWTDAAGSVLYAMAAVFSLRVLWPSRETPRPLVVAAVALGLCVVVELAQLTGLPARVPQLPDRLPVERRRPRRPGGRPPAGRRRRRRGRRSCP